MKQRPRASAAVVLKRLRGLIGARHVVADARSTSAAERATYGTKQRITLIARPRTRQELQACVRVANELETPYCLTSGGCNWGYGSRVPPRDDSVLLDLGRLDRIIAFDEKLAYVVVEPGVTFDDLRRFLERRRSKLSPLSVGSSSRASIVGNILERGFGQGGYPDRLAHVCAFEVLLPTGKFLRTGFSRFERARAGPVHRWGLGPSLDGLFSQSNLGIVTSMAVWLKPAPPLADTVQFSVESPRGFIDMMDALQQLRLRGVLRDGCAVSTRARVLAVTQQYPWDDADGETPLPPRIIRALQRLGIRRWMGWAVVGHENVAHRRVQRGLLREALASCVDRLDFSPRALRAPLVPEPNLPYWRKRTAKPRDADPDRDGCGVIMCSPVLPFDGREIARVTTQMERVLAGHGLDSILQVQCASERSVIINCMLLFDRDVASDERAARKCYVALGRYLRGQGYWPYRSTTLGMPPHASDEQERLLSVLKRALDPLDLLSSGRYLPPLVSGPVGPASRSRRRRA